MTVAAAGSGRGYMSSEAIVEAREELRVEREQHRRAVAALLKELGASGQRGVRELVASIANQLRISEETVEDAVWQLLSDGSLTLTPDEKLSLA